MSDPVCPDPIRELKVRAELLHRRASNGDPPARERLRALPELAKVSADAVAAFVERLQRKHCLTVVAREAGFRSWEHAARILGDGDGEPDYGDLLYPKGAGTFLNHWFASYEEAHAVHVERGGYLLAYRRHVFLAERDFVATTLALDPDDADWKAIGFDWVRPRDREARRRLYGRLLAARAPSSAA